ncbi:hypothetical protein PILCRDRAFT_828785 [Piloderma croceum F 1598]|uniref:Uncharacterized protein n=1 Tax=Piloderma croceum (strain F 1598) TaxID=765440 RepID=A0A0C3F0X5_PILCF|nr:hypothetical protein PILCRDRAFT_828785 [Piloderma croceum F 1598]
MVVVVSASASVSSFPLYIHPCSEQASRSALTSMLMQPIRRSPHGRVLSPMDKDRIRSICVDLVDHEAGDYTYIRNSSFQFGTGPLIALVCCMAAPSSLISTYRFDDFVKMLLAISADTTWR